jgi:transposase
MLSEEKVMEILETFDLTGSLRATAKLCGVDHHTVKRYVEARAQGLDPTTTFARPELTDPYLTKIAEWLERSHGQVRADVVHRKLVAMGFEGSERTTRRVVARMKEEYVHAHHRVYKPWVTEPGLWLQFDYGDGPSVAGRHTILFCAWLAWSRFRVVFPLWDKTLPSLAAALDRTFRALGGVPTYLLTDNEKTVTTRHVAGLAVRNRELLGVAHYYGVAAHTCVVADPESKGGTEATVRIAKADVLPRPDNLVGEYSSFAALEVACDEATERFNGRVHRETGERPADRLVREQAMLHQVPEAPYSMAFGETRRVSWSSLVSFGGARYSVPHELCDDVVYVRRSGDEIVICAADAHGAREVARHPVQPPGRMALHDAHYPDRRATPERAPRPKTRQEREFLALGPGAERFLIEAAAGGERRIEDKMTEALLCAAEVGAGAVDEALSLCASLGRFADGDITSILTARGGTRRRIGEDHSLQPGTAGWSAIGTAR